MPEHLVFALTVLVTACVTLGGSWLVSRGNARTADITMLSTALARIATLETRVDSLEARHTSALAYAQRLRDHIYRRVDPPPPDWPDDLIGG
ncbi:MAG: hypothetical protein M0R37_11915 [Bacteroidales bacterium]|nr:hypothetical protein [Bacteroidales bacterium]